LNADRYMKLILGRNMRKHEFNSSLGRCPEYIKVFSDKGLQTIYAYSDKRYPKKIEPKIYEHFTLFVLKYEDVNSAVQAYQKLKLDSKFSFKNLGEKVDEEKKKFKLLLHNHIKSGGMVFQIENMLFSLVETCRNTPIGGSWLAYENEFLSSMVSDRESLVVLNADCGDMYFKEEKRLLD